LALASGGGLQQVLSRANTSWMVLTWAGSACAQVEDVSSSAAAIRNHG